MSEINKEGLLIVISGPSGVGKTTIAHRIRDTFDATFSVSATTRPKSAAEVDGVDYFFITNESFDSMIADNEFLEYAEVFGCHRYGTIRKSIEDSLTSGQLILLDIDVQGGMQVQKSMPNSVRIFILPPDEDELLQRLEIRGRDDKEAIQRRFCEAKQEILKAKQSGAYTYFITNDDLDFAVAEAISIITEHQKRNQILND
mgnify:CR=1 FL=1